LKDFSNISSFYLFKLTNFTKRVDSSEIKYAWYDNKQTNKTNNKSCVDHMHAKKMDPVHKIQ